MNSTAILLATFNPGQNLVDQLNSLKNQTFQDFKIYWGDDGSDEVERKWIREQLNSFNFSEFHYNQIGASRNFLSLLGETSEEFVAFCDQDDVWVPNKIKNQIAALQPYMSIPSASHSAVNILKNGVLRDHNYLCQDHSISKLVAANCCRGCTLMINAKAREVILRVDARLITWHDWFIISTIASQGYVHSTANSFVNYRIHSRNTIGIPSVGKKIVNQFKREEGKVVEQFELIYDNFQSDIDKNQLKELIAFLSLFDSNHYKRLVKILFDRKRRKTWPEDLFRRIIWLIKRP